MTEQGRPERVCGAVPSFLAVVFSGLPAAFCKKADSPLAEVDGLIGVDLDGDGINATTIDSLFPILFDHKADGIKTATGCIRSDATLPSLWIWMATVPSTWGENFGDNTLLPAGSAAANGFAAIAQCKRNQEGVIDAGDPAYTQLRIWEDANQDAIS